MPLVSPPTVTALPTPPDPNDRSTFVARAYPWSVALSTHSTELSALASNVYANATYAVSYMDSATAAAASSASAAASSEFNAAQSANAAAVAAGAVKWVSGTAYAEGVVVWSPINYQPYRRKSAGSGATDPGADSANWALLGAALSAPQQTILANTAAISGTHYIATAALTLTLPSAPGVRDLVVLTKLTSGAITVARNGQPIMGLAEDLNVDVDSGTVRLAYTGATYGWVIA